MENGVNTVVSLDFKETYANIGSTRETGVQINTSALVPNRVILWNGTGTLAHYHNLCEPHVFVGRIHAVCGIV